MPPSPAVISFTVLKAEGTHEANTAGARSVPFGAVRVGGVLNERDTVLACNVAEGVHVGHRTAEVDGNDGARLRTEGFAYALGVDVEGVRLNIHKDRRGA